MRFFVRAKDPPNITFPEKDLEYLIPVFEPKYPEYELELGNIAVFSFSCG